MESEQMPNQADKVVPEVLVEDPAIALEKANVASVLESNHDLSLKQSVGITFKEINYSIPLKQTFHEKRRDGPKFKPILNGVTGTFRAGRLTAIMGASGAGKTSLLQVLAGEARNGELDGEIFVNGFETDGQQLKKMSGFVFQDDIILASMTVEEAIGMSATLRLPASLSKEKKAERVEGMIKMLNLNKARNTMMGNAIIKGVSGGERKRVAMAMEAITNPPVLFLDEPTSGLDTFTAYSVVSTLKSLAEAGRTVVCTIHQPSSKIFRLFDDLLLLANGKVIYQGPCQDTVSYFSKLGYECPTFSNPADFIFMSILNNEDGEPPAGAVTKEQSEKKETNADRINRLLKSYQDSDEAKYMEKLVSDHKPAGEKQTDLVVKTESTFQIQLEFLFQRAFSNLKRNPMIIKARAFQVLFISVIIGLLFYRTDLVSGYAGHQNRTGVLFFLILNNLMGSMMGVLSVFMEEKRVFSREHGAGYYRLLPYFLSKVTIEMPFFVILPWIQVTLLYWTIGLQNNGNNYAIEAVIITLVNLCGFALGIFFACSFSSLEVALGIAPTSLLPMIMFGGLFANAGTFPNYLNWIQYISPVKYAFEASVKNEYTGIYVSCYAANPSLKIDGTFCIDLLGFNDNLTILYCCLILLLFVFGLLFFAYRGLVRIVRIESKVPKLKKKISA